MSKTDQNKTVAYLRVSTSEQDIEKNKVELILLANEKNLGKVHFVEETISGKISWRSEEHTSELQSR